MSGSDRTLTAVRRVNRITRTGVARQQAKSCQPRVTQVNAGAGEKLDAQAAREIRITRALAVAALGAERVLKAERLRAKGWSVRGIASQVGCTEAEARALFGEGGPL